MIDFVLVHDVDIDMSIYTVMIDLDVLLTKFGTFLILLISHDINIKVYAYMFCVLKI